MDRLAIYGDNKLGIDKISEVEQCRVTLRLVIMQICHGLTLYYRYLLTALGTININNAWQRY